MISDGICVDQEAHYYYQTSAVVLDSARMGILGALTHRNNDLGFIELATFEQTGTIMFLVALRVFGVRHLAGLDVGLVLRSSKRSAWNYLTMLGESKEGKVSTTQRTLH